MEKQTDNVILDAATRRNLEITQNLSGGTDNTLASILDLCVTPMGSRMLKRWLHTPLRHIQTLTNRQQAIAALQECGFELLQPLLRQIGDLERVLARLALRSARPRDLARMRHAFEQYQEIHQILNQSNSEYLQNLQNVLTSLMSYRIYCNVRLLMHRLYWCVTVALSLRVIIANSMNGEHLPMELQTILID